MKIGVPKEIKNHEYRVGLNPNSIQELVHNGATVLVERGAGRKAGHSDKDYETSGARLVGSAEEVFEASDLIIKVKEPQPNECRMLNEGQTLFTYLHLAPDLQQTDLLKASKASCIAYETIYDKNGNLPLLSPMSEVAGRLSVIEAAHHLLVPNHGKGLLMSGVPGTEPAKVVILGGGVVGYHAATMALGLNAEVTILDISLDRLRTLHAQFQGKVKCIFSTHSTIEQYCLNADVIVGAVLSAGAAAPKILSEDLISRLEPGTVVADVAIDQGGCFATSKATTHENPTYLVHDVVHYCVANIPGAVAQTSTAALNNATLPYICTLLKKGVKKALLDDELFRAGLNIHAGVITCEAVAKAQNDSFINAKDALQ